MMTDRRISAMALVSMPSLEVFHSMDDVQAGVAGAENPTFYAVGTRKGFPMTEPLYHWPVMVLLRTLPAWFPPQRCPKHHLVAGIKRPKLDPGFKCVCAHHFWSRLTKANERIIEMNDGKAQW